MRRLFHNVDVTLQADAPLPDDIATLKAMLLAERQAYGAKVRDQALLIEKLEQQIARLRHERFGQSSERRALLDQLELQLFELKEDQARAEPAIANPEVGASAATQMPLIEAIGAQETCGDPCREARGTHHGTIFRIYGYSTGRHFPQEATRPTLIGSDSCRDRRFLANAPQRIRSIGHRKWVCVGLQEGWYEIDSLLASHGIDSPGKVIEIHDSGLPQRKKPSCE